MIFLPNVWADNQTGDQQANKSEPPEEFGKFGENRGRYPQFDSILQKIGQQGMARRRSGFGYGAGSDMMDHLEENDDTLSDGMDEDLKNAATYFEMDEEEVEKEDYSFRYDATFPTGSTYDIKVSWITMSIFLGYHCFVFIFNFRCLFVLVLSYAWGHYMFYVQIDNWCSDKLYTFLVGGIEWNIVKSVSQGIFSILIAGQSDRLQ